MANANVSTRDTQLEKQRLGFIAITFSNMDNTSEPKIQSGSVVEVAGTLYSFSSEESNTDWAGIGNGTQAYLILDPAGDSSSVSAKWTDNAPAWSEAKFGWYGDGVTEDADNRYILRCYKDASGNYDGKYKYAQAYGNEYNAGDKTFPDNLPFSNIETLSTPGSDNWAVPAGVYHLNVLIIGAGGGGGAGTTDNGASGGDTTFNSITSSGGIGGRAADAEGIGRPSHDGLCAGNGGGGAMRYDDPESYTGGDGTGGQIKFQAFSVTPGDSIAYTIGAGGGGGASGVAGGSGGDGQIIIMY